MEQERREREREAREKAHEAGMKGGAAAMAAGVPYTETRAALAYWSPDTIRWGPVWSGLLVTFGIHFVLAAIGVGSAFGGYNAASPNFFANVAAFLSVWLAASMIVAVFFGGWVAGRSGAKLGMRQGWLQGTIVWALMLLFSLAISSMFLSGAVGSITSLSPLAARMIPAGGGVSVSSAQAVTASRVVAGTIAYAAWVYLIATVLQWVAAALGGWAGARGHVQEAAVEQV